MKVSDIVNKLESGTALCIYSSVDDKTLYVDRVLTVCSKWYICNNWGNMEVLAINTSADDVDIELVVE